MDWAGYVEPEVTVLGNGVSINDGDPTPDTADDTDFGTVVQGGTPISHTFTVRNDGGSTLTIRSMNVPSGFTVTEGLPATLAAGASDTFTVQLDTAMFGTKTGDVSFANGDTDESLFDFRIAGTVNWEGSLDPLFSDDGKVTTAVGPSSDYAYSVAIQPWDQKIVVAGYCSNGSDWDFALARYNADGSLDTSFSDDGIVTTPVGLSSDYGYSVALQPDHKIVVAGSSFNGSNDDFAVVRYNPDGSLDTFFNGTGKVTTDIGGSSDYGHSVAIRPDGEIVVAGYTYNGSGYDFAVVRYTAGGSLDTSFNGTGKVTTDLGGYRDYGYSVALQSDGRIVVAGTSGDDARCGVAVVRYNANGSLDTSFGGGTGKVTTAVGAFRDYGYSVAVQSDDKIVVAGYSYNGSDYDLALVRYEADGSLDTSFNGTGKVTIPIASSGHDGLCGVALQADGKIVVAGDSQQGGNYDFALARFNTDGTLDTSFGEAGKVRTPIGASLDYGRGVAIQADGKIVVAGFTYVGSYWNGSTWVSDWDFALARYEAENAVAFADANLKAAVEAALGVTNPKPHQMPGLISLSAAGKGISSLKGLEYATNLTTLDLSGNQIVDISALSGMTKLTSLNLENNQITDIGPLSGLTSLTWLALDGNKLGDPDHQRMADLSPLSGLVHLTELYLSRNQITDIDSLSGLTRLTRLELGSNRISDLTPLQNLTNLTELHLQWNQIVSLSGLERLTKLVFLTSEGNQINDISVLSGLTSLYWLDLEHNQVHDVSALARLTNLAAVYFWWNQIHDISALTGLTHLRTLDLRHNRLDHEAYTTYLPRIQTNNPGITLLYYPEEEAVHFADANLQAAVEAALEVTDPRPTEMLDLDWLTAQHPQDPSHQISDLTGLEYAKNLRGLDLGGNQIVDLTPLKELTSLTWLWLSGNQISDISALVSGFSSLTWADLHQNPLNRQAYATDIPWILANRPGLVLEYDAPGTIAGIAWADQDGDGVRDDGEPGLGGWTIRVKRDGDATWTYSTTTGSDGSYAFANLSAGTYILGEDLESGWIQTCPAGAGTRTVAVNPGQTVTGIDFGSVVDDNDGIPRQEEQGPNGDDPYYDGNGDGQPDWVQSNVASLPTVTGRYVTLACDKAFKLVNVRSVANPFTGDLPVPIEELPYGFFEFQVTGLPAAGAAIVDLHVPDGTLVNSYYKYGPTPDQQTPHWYEFNWDETTGTGAKIEGNVIHLYFRDGSRGDDDLTVNGVIVEPGAPAMENRLRGTGWTGVDIGGPSPSSLTDYDPATGRWMIQASGDDIWNEADQFCYVYRYLQGDGQITALVVSIDNASSDWCKVGVMMRESLDPSSNDAYMVMTPGVDQNHAESFQWRSAANPTGGDVSGGSMTLPYWVRLVRQGDTFIGYYSPNGSDWTQAGEVTIPMRTKGGQAGCYIGLCVTSHANGNLCTATIDHVSITTSGTGEVTDQPPPQWQAWGPSPANGSTVGTIPALALIAVERRRSGRWS